MAGVSSSSSSSHFPPLRSSFSTAAAAAAATATTPLLSDSDASTSGGEEADDDHNPAAFEDSIFSAYLHVSGGKSTNPADLAKIRSFLASSRRGSFLACLICLERIRPADPTWSCSSGCHASFHLFCIQSWAQQCCSLLPSATALNHNPSWHCPKCRLNYEKSLIPRSYLCYCGKVENPPQDPWILPHSCGEVCGRNLRDNCGHECLLLCHPGPCPPCPKLVSTFCFCGSIKDARRCASKLFSCGNRCSKSLSCGIHRCVEKCHEGQCPPCRVKGNYKCLCGSKEEVKECSERKFRCERSCGGLLGCGKHKCERGCHAGTCGDCPLQGKRTCPCGKKIYRGLACDVNVPTCASTCEKMLSCNVHRCPERCHRGDCAEICRTIIWKSCRCGSLKKEVPCHQDLVCERKCQRLRDCGRHACKRRCCEGDCPSCPEICGRKLRCNNHKCSSPCHRGTCAPCPLMVTISCFCGETHYEVPCGMEKDQKPPRCSKPCQISRLCRHSSECRKHRCHYGACPLCRMTCEEELLCGHTCKQRCHGPIPPANPEFSLKPKKKKFEQQQESKPGSPCPPCQEVVLKSCLGQHVGEERAMLCSDKRRFSCANQCGNLLQCGNHYCTKPCHALLRPDHVNKDIAESCEDCFLPCQKERKPACQHLCPLPCHTGYCPPCKVLIKRSCHCRSMVHVFECIYYNSLSDKEQQRVRSCGGPCHRKLSNCPHLCPEICHPDHCPSDKCRKKVIVRCSCQSLKKEWLCQELQDFYRDAGCDPKDVSKGSYGHGILPCNAVCASKLKAVESEMLHRKTKVIEDKEPSDKENVPKRRKRRDPGYEDNPVENYFVCFNDCVAWYNSVLWLQRCISAFRLDE